jgi:hypothetical protein
MNGLKIATVFFVLSFAGSLIYSVKTKKRSLFSYLLNLEFEYILVGTAVYYFSVLSSDATATPAKPLLYLLLTFMGLVIGTSFSFNLLKTVHYRIFLFILLVYITGLGALYALFAVADMKYPFIYAVSVNSMMPYAINLCAKIFKMDREKAFFSRLTASLFPMLVLCAYTLAAGVHDFRPAGFFTSIGLGVILIFVFMYFGKSRELKTVNMVNIIFVICLSGAAMFNTISPIVTGFIVGVFLADTDYGSVFHNMTRNYERFLYIFFYVVLGMFLAYGGLPDMKHVLTAVAAAGVLTFVRCFLAPAAYMRLLPTKEDITGFLSVGILPAVLMLDFGTREGFGKVSPFFSLFFIIHLITEIFTYVRIKRMNERETV